MNEMNRFGQFVRQRREQLGIISRVLAAQLDLDPSTLSRLETGTMKTLPTESDMAKMVTDIGKMVPDVAALRYSDAAMRATLALLGQVVFDGTVRIAYAPEYRDAFPHPTVIRPVYTRAAFGEVGTWRLERVTD
jgi:transcriptional regulator with XRE-family HTH domain